MSRLGNRDFWPFQARPFLLPYPSPNAGGIERPHPAELAAPGTLPATANSCTLRMDRLVMRAMASARTRSGASSVLKVTGTALVIAASPAVRPGQHGRRSNAVLFFNV